MEEGEEKKENVIKLDLKRGRKRTHILQYIAYIFRRAAAAAAATADCICPSDRTTAQPVSLGCACAIKVKGERGRRRRRRTDRKREEGRERKKAGRTEKDKKKGEKEKNESCKFLKGRKILIDHAEKKISALVIRGFCKKWNIFTCARLQLISFVNSAQCPNSHLCIHAL